MKHELLWNYKTETFKRAVTSFDLLDGGFKMMNIDRCIESIKIGCTKRLPADKFLNRMVIQNFCLNEFGSNLLILKINANKIYSLTCT